MTTRRSSSTCGRSPAAAAPPTSAGRLDGLRQQGVISDEEFQQLKAKALA